jgi:excisionase family DNA binding protein
MSEIEPIALSVTQAAKYISIGVRQMRELIRAKKIKAHMLPNGLIRVTTQSCAEFLESLPPYKKAKGLRNQTRH